MTAWPSVLGALAALVPATVAADDGPAPSTTLFSIQAADVFESSGLVDVGPVVYTTNDSGDDAVLYGLDSGSGELVSRTTYADDVRDVEALAPGRDGVVWAGDIGDNREKRDSVTVYAVEPRPGDTTRPARAYELTYPDGPHNAEALLVQPRTGRVLVVTKSPFGGTVYAAPVPLRDGGPQRMTRFARVPGLVTDGAFFPDGRHVVLRTYTSASAYTFPGFAPLGTVQLPPQPQGEGISVARDGRVLVSSEGVRSAVLQVTLPPAFDGGAPPSAVPTSPAGPSPSPARGAEPERPGRTASGWGWTVLAAAGIGVAGYLSLRASRPRGPRRR